MPRPWPLLLLLAHGCEDCEEQSVQLLQTGMRKPKALPLPIHWLHVPKCGSSFLNTLVHLPGVCPSLPEDILISEETMGPRFLNTFLASFDFETTCPGLDDYMSLGHQGLGDPGSEVYEGRRGKVMTMLREPRERLMSAYRDMEGVWRRGDLLFFQDQSSSWGGWAAERLPSLPEFAAGARGCAVRLMTRWGLVCGAAAGMPSDDEVALAKKRLKEDVAFVGITGRWEESMCLFHKMFGEPCDRKQFLDTRPGRDKRKPQKEAYNFTELQGVEDPYDTELYNEAVRLFEERLKDYGATDDGCRACWRAANVTLA